MNLDTTFYVLSDFLCIIKLSLEDEYDVKKLYQANPRHELTCRGEVTNW